MASIELRYNTRDTTIDSSRGILSLLVIIILIPLLPEAKLRDINRRSPPNTANPGPELASWLLYYTVQATSVDGVVFGPPSSIIINKELF